MKQFIAIVTLLMLSAAAEADTLVADRAYGVMHNPAELKLDYLPQDQHKPYITVMGTGPRFEQVVAWFDSGELKRLKDASHFNAIDTTSAMFRDRYAASTPGKLTIRIQDSTGKTQHELRDGQIPLSAEAFVRQTNKTECLRKWCEPKRPDQTDPPAQPLEPPVVVTPEPKQSPIWLCVLAVIVAGIIGSGYGLYRELSGKPRM